MTLKEWILLTNKSVTKDSNLSLSVSENFLIRPRIYCKDGFHMSLQGSSYHYSNPKEISENYIEMEVGFPSGKEELLIDNKIKGRDVYHNVHFSIVEEIINKHGGIDEIESFK